VTALIFQLSRQLIARVDRFLQQVMSFGKPLVVARFTGGGEVFDPPANPEALTKVANNGVQKSCEENNQNERNDSGERGRVGQREFPVSDLVWRADLSGAGPRPGVGGHINCHFQVDGNAESVVWESVNANDFGEVF